MPVWPVCSTELNALQYKDEVVAVVKLCHQH